MVVGGLATLATAVMLLASMPNSSEQQLREINLWLLSVLVVGAASLGGGIWGVWVRRPWLAAGLGIGPAVYAAVLMILLTARHR